MDTTHLNGTSHPKCGALYKAANHSLSLKHFFSTYFLLPAALLASSIYSPGLVLHPCLSSTAEAAPLMTPPNNRRGNPTSPLNENIFLRKGFGL